MSSRCISLEGKLKKAQKKYDDDRTDADFKAVMMLGQLLMTLREREEEQDRIAKESQKKLEATPDEISPEEYTRIRNRAEARATFIGIAFIALITATVILATVLVGS
jgi:hypothetical protein